MTSMTQRPGIGINVRETNGTQYDATLTGDRPRYLIGRQDRKGATVVDLGLEDRHISRRHCALQWDDAAGFWTLVDLNSANGTTLNGETVGTVPPILADGAEVKLGATLLTLRFDKFSSDSGHPASATAMAGAEGGDETRLFLPALSEEATVMMAPDLTTDMATALMTPGAPARAAATVTSISPQPAVPADGAETVAMVDGQATVALAPAPPAIDKTQVMAPAASPAPSVTVPAAPAAPSDNSVVSTIRRLAAAGASLAHGGGESRTERRRTDDPAQLVGGIVRTLVAANLLDASKAASLCRVARESGRTFCRVMAEDATIRLHQDVYERIAESLGLELLDDEKKLMERAVPTAWLPFSLAGKIGAVMLSGGVDTAFYATVDPYDITLDDWIARCSEKPVAKVVVPYQVFQSALQRLKNQGEDTDSGGNVLVIEISPQEELRISTQIDNIDVPQVVNYFLQRGFMQGASDIHIEPTEEFLLVRNRVDGILHEDTTLPATLHAEISSRVKIISGMDVAEKRRPQDGRISSIIRGNPIDVRVSSYPTIYGEKVVMRLLDKNALRPSPEHLGMLGRDLRLLYDKLSAPFGLVMISGPTGSGKTTTLYSCLGSIDKKTKNVLTVEDPVEYRLKGVHQMQVNDKIGLTFASGLRTILRQDPDVIMIGECRDNETAGMAIQAALTGHIVFSTIHTNDAVGVITRLLDMGIDRFLVANALTMCIAQRLVRKVCKHCQQTVDGDEVLRRLDNEGVSRDRLQQLGIEVDEHLTYVIGSGCVHCRNTGYLGRQAVFEVFEMTNQARNAILSPDFNADVLRRMARDIGMTTLIGHGMAMIEDGVTTHAEVIRVLGEAY